MIWLKIWPLFLVAVTHQTSMAVMNIGAALGAAGILFRRWRDWPALWRTRVVQQYVWISSILVLSLVVSLIGASLWPYQVAGAATEVRWFGVLKAWYFALPLVWALEWRALSSVERSKIVHAWMLVFGSLSLFAVVQHWTGWFNPQRIPGFVERFHSTAFLGHHLSLASVWLFATFAALSMDRRLYRVIGALGAMALVLSFARSLWIALPIAMGVFYLRVLPKKIRWPSLAIGIVLVVAALQIPAVSNRLFSSWGVGERFELWRMNAEFFRSRPLTGVGFRLNEPLSGMAYMHKFQTKHGLAGHAHNNVIEMLGGTGLFGTLAWLMWNGFIALLFWRHRVDPIGWAFACAFLAYQINGLTQVNFWEGKVLHALMWAVGLALTWGQIDRSKPRG